MEFDHENFLNTIINHKLSLNTIIKKPLKERKAFCKWFQSKFEFEQKSNLIQLGPLIDTNACNSHVSMAYDLTFETLVVVKKTIHHDGSYIVPLNIMYELTTFLKIKNENSNHLPKLLNVNVTEYCTDIVSVFIPIGFRLLFCLYQSPAEFIDLKIKELIKTVDLLHSKGIAHRDIKSSNIRFTSNSSLVLLDFDSTAPCKIRSTLPMCTLNNRAPELIRLQYECKTNNYDAFACDWWSVGCVLAEMFLQTNLFQADNETHPTVILLAIESFCLKLHSVNGVEPLKRRMPTALYSLLQLLLTEDPQKRMDNITRWKSQ